MDTHSRIPRHRAIGLLGLGLMLSVSARSGQAVALRGFSVFDPVEKKMLTDRTIVVREGTIESVAEGRTKIPRGARVIDGKKKFLVPGLIDAHVHLVHQTDSAHMTPEEVLPWHLAYGVTSLRDTGDEIVAEKMTQRFAEAHPESSPRVFLCSPLIDGDPPFHRDIGRALTDPAKVPEFLEDMKGWGVTTLKIYVKTDRDVGRRVVDLGRQMGFVVTAHLGRYQAQDAVPDGIDVLEHIWSVFNYSLPNDPADKRSNLERRASADLTSPKAVALRDLLKRHGTTVNPTLAVFRNMILLNDLPEIHGHADNSPTPKRLLGHWDAYRARSALKPETLDLRRREFRKYQELTGLLHSAGIPLLAGTDTPEPYVPPGAALHQELEMLVESGLTPADALQAATWNNSRALKQEKTLGRIAPGYAADLLILGANPLDDIRNTRRIERVMVRGRVLDPAVLLKLVPKQ
ncbi:MAG: amidohydrolase family protein [Bryobacteraceae bacterium]